MDKSVLHRISKEEGVSLDLLSEGLSAGTIVVPRNKKRKVKRPIGIGDGLRTKVNANIGTSSDSADLKTELKKMKAAETACADSLRRHLSQKEAFIKQTMI